MADYKMYKRNGIWWAIVVVGGSTVTVVATNFNWLMQILASVFGIK